MGQTKTVKVLDSAKTKGAHGVKDGIKTTKDVPKCTMMPEELVWMTPEMAYEILQANPLNRPIRVAKVNKIADDIRNGKWDDNGDTIRINIDTGDLIDGQHRLNAVFEAQTPVWMRVVRIKPTFRIDDNTPRSLADKLIMSGIVQKGSAGSRGSCLSIAKFLLKTTMKGNDDFDVPDIGEFTNTYEEQFSFIRRLSNLGHKAARTCNVKGMLSAGIFAACFVAMENGISRDSIESWYKAVVTGDYNEQWEKTSVNRFRNFLINNMKWSVDKPSSKSEFYEELYNKAQQSLYYYSRKAEMTAIRNEPVWNWSRNSTTIKLDDIHVGDLFEIENVGILPVKEIRRMGTGPRVVFSTGKIREPEKIFAYPAAFEHDRIRRVVRTKK